MNCRSAFGAFGLLFFAAAIAAAAEADKGATIAPEPRADAGWTARHEALNARVKQGDADLIFVGDSLAQGWEDLGKEAWNRFHGKRKAVNLGIGGDQAKNILWRLEHGNIEGISPKLAVVTIGADTGEGTAAEIAGGIQAVVGKLREKLPKTKVLLLGILPVGANREGARRETVAAANQVLAKSGEGKVKLEEIRTVAYLDFTPAFLGADGAPRPDLLAPNGRLSAQGYALLAEWLEQGVVSMTGERENPLLPVPLDPGAWLRRHESMNARVRKGGVDLVFVGDSIVNGWEGEGKAVWEKFYGKRNAVNLGISRDRVQHALWRLDHGNIEGISPKLAVVMIGTNNASRSDIEQTTDGIKAIVNRLRAKSPATKVLLLGIFPRGENAKDRWRQVNMKVNENIAKFADEKTVFYMDIGPKLAAEDGTLPKDIMPDHLHPSAKGYTVWAEAIEPLVAKLMGE